MGGSESRHTAGFPAELTSFVGRREERAEAKRLLSAARLLTLTGAGGVGKTRLAVHVAKDVSRAFPGGVVLVPLAALEDEAFVPDAVMDALGMRNEAVRPSLDALIDYLRDRQLLLVLDNCEHLLTACAVLVGAVLSGAPGVRVLATSRHRLGLLGEQLLDVPPLAAPAPEKLAAGPPDAVRFPALQLFADRVAAVVPDFEVNDENHRAVALLCSRLDGLPLAIELAAVRVRAFGVEQLAQGLDDRYRLLTGGSPVSDARHRTLRSAVDWSHDLCTPQEQLVWAWLSVFVGSFDLAAAEAVCAAEGHGPVDVMEAIAGLVDKSVLIREGHNGDVRYRLLVSLRDYGLGRLRNLGEETATRLRHRDHYCRLATAFEQRWFGPGQPEITARLRADQDNIRSALAFSFTTPGEAQEGLRLNSALWFYWIAGGTWGEGRRWTDRALRAGARPDAAMTTLVWTASAVALIHTRSAAIVMSGAPQQGAAEGELPHPAPPPGGGTRAWPASVRLLSFAVLTRVELACSLVFRGTAQPAVALCTEAAELCEEHGEQWLRGYALRTLAMARWAMDDDEGATEHARACVRLAHTAREPRDLARALDLLAAIGAGAANREEEKAVSAAERSAVLQGAADRIWHDIGRDPTMRLKPGQVRVSERRARQAIGDRGYAEAVRRGDELAEDEIVAYVLRAGSAAPRRPARPAQPPALTPRETEVAGLIARGLTNKQIAETLVVSRRTAEGHVERILTKLGFTNRSQVAVWFSSEQGERPGEPGDHGGGAPPPSR